MILKFTYQQKLKLLPFLFIAAMLVVYWIAISGTVKLKHTCIDLKAQLKSAGNAPEQLLAVTARLNELNRNSGNSRKEEGTDPFLNFISISSNSAAKLINYLPLHNYRKAPYLIETRSAIFEGIYSNLLSFLYSLEKNYTSGKVVSVKFETETNLKTEKRRLLMTLYIQSVSSEKNPAGDDKSTPKP